MYNSNHKRIGTIGYVYLALAFIGFLYYLLTFTISVNKMSSETALLRSHTRTMLVFVCLMEIFIGVYIQNATHKVFLFLQALATMLLFVVHGFYIYAFFNLDGTLSFSSQNAIDTGLILLLLCALLHGATLFEYKFKVVPPADKPVYIDEEIDFEEEL